MAGSSSAATAVPLSASSAASYNAVRNTGPAPNGLSGPASKSKFSAEGAILADQVLEDGRPLLGHLRIPIHRPSGCRFSVSMRQHIGHRKTQEDCFVVAPSLPRLCGDGPCAFFSVFDGTVGDFASTRIRDLALLKLTDVAGKYNLSENMRHAPPQRKREILEDMTINFYKELDGELLNLVSKEQQQHYATCTSVTMFLVQDLLVIAHLGDSRIVFGGVDPKMGVRGIQMTNDHKPDQEKERNRIESCGGMVERLQSHSHKPFIRGGDFLMRKTLGEQPMQLQYSRAFGGKDLKIFGLSNEPDVKVVSLADTQVKIAILASDGLWDVMTAQEAVQLALEAISAKSPRDPAERLIDYALKKSQECNTRADNITVVVVIFDQ